MMRACCLSGLGKAIRLAAQDSFESGKRFFGLHRYLFAAVLRVFTQQTIESCRDGGVVMDVTSEEIAQSQKGSDHLCVSQSFPSMSVAQLIRTHLDKTVADRESRDPRLRWCPRKFLQG